MPGNVIAMIDFGMVGALTPRDLNFLSDFAIGFARRNGDTISKALITLCGKKFFEREEELRFEIRQMMMQYTGVPIETVNFAGAMQACIDVIVKYQLQIPSGIFMLIKALATLEKFAATLDPQLSLAPIILPYAKQIVKEKYAPRKIAGMLYDTLSSYVGFIRSFPDDASEILYKLKEGKIKHDIRLDDNALFVRTIKAISRRIAYVIVLVGLFIGSTLLMVFDKGNAYGRFILIARLGTDPAANAQMALFGPEQIDAGRTGIASAGSESSSHEEANGKRLRRLSRRKGRADGKEDRTGDGIPEAGGSFGRIFAKHNLKSTDMSKIAKHLTDLIGGTPLLELSNYSREHGLKATLIAKLEYFNPGGSVKDRIALAMIEDAERRGILKPGPRSSSPRAAIRGSGWRLSERPKDTA